MAQKLEPHLQARPEPLLELAPVLRREIALPPPVCFALAVLPEFGLRWKTAQIAPSLLCRPEK